MSEFEQNAVSRVTWVWSDPCRTAPTRQVNKAALIRSGIMAVVAFVLYHVIGWHHMATVALVLAVIVLVSGLFVPPLWRVIEQSGHALGRGIGVVVTWIVLPPFFYTCFLFGRITLVVLKKDPMTRCFHGKDVSYWVPHCHSADPKRYTKQYA